MLMVCDPDPLCREPGGVTGEFQERGVCFGCRHDHFVICRFAGQGMWYGDGNQNQGDNQDSGF